jgi:6-hydroxymethylpterin diphosphokinase MptE-like
MTLDQCLNPLYVYRNRERMLPFLKKRSSNFIRNRQLKQFKNRHPAERCFIIGNGPSLAVEDLDKLRLETTFASNKIYLAFDQTVWRPSYYVVEDDHMIRQHHKIIGELTGFVKFVSDDWASVFHGKNNVIMYPRTLLDLNRFPRFSENASRYVFCGYMVTYISLQLAYFMGFSRVYLLGVDFDYSLSHDGADTIVHQPSDPSDHFTPEYFAPGEQRYAPQLSRAQRAMLCARDFYDANGRKILNATRGGKLEVFERISLEEALAQ